MKRYQITCLDGKQRWIFAKSGNAIDKQTGTALIVTDDKLKAYKEHGVFSLAYFQKSANGLEVKAI
jgi:hypothetical protein